MIGTVLMPDDASTTSAPERGVMPADEWAEVGTAKDVRKRLAQFVRSRYSSISEFSEETGLPRSSVPKWKRGEGSFPSLPKLMVLAAKGLSLDWLLTGDGSMKRVAARTERGMLVQHLRLFLQREARVDADSDRRAFFQLETKLGADKILERAATALQTDYDRALTDIKRTEDYAGLVGFLTGALDALDGRRKPSGNEPPLWRVQNQDVQGVRQIVNEMRSHLEAFLPSFFREGDDLATKLRQQADQAMTQRERARQQKLHDAFFPTAQLVLEAVHTTQERLQLLHDDSTKRQDAFTAELQSVAQILASLAVAVMELKEPKAKRKRRPARRASAKSRRAR